MAKEFKYIKANIAPGFLFHKPHTFISNLVNKIKYYNFPLLNIDTEDGTNHKLWAPRNP